MAAVRRKNRGRGVLAIPSLPLIFRATRFELNSLGDTAMLIGTAYAQAGGAPGAFDFVSLMPLILIFVVFYFLLIRPQQKKMKQHREMIASLKRGDKILTSGGIIGTIVKVEEEEGVLLVEIAKDVRVRIARATVSDLLSKPAPAAAAAGGGVQQPGAGAANSNRGGGLMSRLFGSK